MTKRYLAVISMFFCALATANAFAPTQILAETKQIQSLKIDKIPVSIQVNGKENKINTVQYHGFMKPILGLPKPFLLIKSSSELEKLLANTGYKLPNIDFQEYAVVFEISDLDQCAYVTIFKILFKDKKIDEVMEGSVLKAREKTEGTVAFVLVILPKSLIPD